MTDMTTDKSLSDAMYTMSLAKRVPDVDLLEDFVRRYPQHADALTEFAIGLAVDALLYGDEEFDLPADNETISPMVARAMSRFQNRLFEMREERPSAPQPRASSAIVNPFASLGRDDFRALASKIYANTVFVSKLRDRQIDFKTIPARYVRHVAAQMSEDLEALTAHLAAVAEVRQAEPQQPRQFYKAEGKPGSARRQTFEEAVRSSGLSAEQESRLLAFRD
jgi:hypothetical protein